jgi:hypothetical protein
MNQGSTTSRRVYAKDACKVADVSLVLGQSPNVGNNSGPN